jgi:class 3 adenylate cyclase
MGLDEEGTHERLQAHFRELVEPKIEEHRGRVVKNTGDGLLAEFASVVDAARFAVEVQRGMAERNGSVPREKRIEFRVGINLGDVIVEDEDIFGDGVNVAARLEALAEPGGSASAEWYATTSATSSITRSRISASTMSRTSPGRCALIAS